MTQITRKEVGFWTDTADLPKGNQEVNVADTTIEITNGPDSFGIGAFATKADVPTGYKGIAVIDKQITVSDGVTSLAQPYILIQSGIPLVIPSSGTIGNNGALTAITALPSIYPKAYMYFPVGAIYTASLAGWYFVIPSLTTAATIYAEMYTSGVPVIPANPTPIVATGPGAYTQSTAVDIDMLNTVLPANSLGPNGCYVTNALFSYNNSAGTKTPQIKLGGTAHYAQGATTTASLSINSKIANQGVVNKQVCQSNTITPTAGVFPYITKDTTTDLTISMTGKIAVATDTLTMEHTFITVYPAN